MKVIAFIGAEGSGKDTAANYFIEHHGYQKVSFAGPLKDIAALAFGWNREMLEGVTPESREWRERTDPFFGVTPRYALQKIGTEMFRAHICEDFWIRCMRRAIDTANAPVVITDCRFENEFQFLNSIGATVVYVQRPLAEEKIPQWVRECAKKKSDTNARDLLTSCGLHPSSYELFSFAHLAHVTLKNDKSIEDLKEKCSYIIEK